VKIRQRIRVRTSPVAYVGRTLLALLALALVWYGLMLVLLAAKLSPDTVDAISRYRTAFDYFAGLQPGDVTSRVRLIAGLSGLVVFAVCCFLAWKELPRPYLTRGDLSLLEDEQTTITVKPRAIERAAENAVVEHPAVIGAAARYGEQLSVDIEVRGGRDLAQTMREAQLLVADALGRLELPPLPVSVILAGFDRRQREIQ
jgi:hypothetical protein